MTDRSSSRRHPFARLLLTAWLVLGLLLQPVMAAACDVGDARQALAAQDDARQAGDGAGARDRDGSAHPAQEGAQVPGDPDCCANPACGDCCLTATATLPARAPLVHAPPAPGPFVHGCVAVAPRRVPVENPPPILG